MLVQAAGKSRLNLKTEEEIMSDGKILAFYAPYNEAGKTTAAGILDDKESIIFSFASPLYYYAKCLISLVSKNEPRDEFGGKSLRDFLIYFGQSGREFYPNIWSEKMRRSINDFKHSLNIIIDDLRFPNEYAMLNKEGAKIVRITNPGREIIKTETEGLLEGYKFDYELINYKRGLDVYRTDIAEMMRELWP